LNLIYQWGRDYQNYTYAITSRCYSCGITYIAGRDYAGDGQPFLQEQVALRGRVGDNRNNTSWGMPTSGHLYDVLTGPVEVTVYDPTLHGDSSKDLYTAMTLDQGLTLAPGERQDYVVGIVSDTLEHFAYGPMSAKSSGTSGLEDAVQRAWAWAADHVFCTCPCHADPMCDGHIGVLDVVQAINVAFRNFPAEFDYDCAYAQTDVTCDSATDVTDVVHFINVAFRNADPEGEFCNPCAQ
jgi:hypothetical protein